VSSINRSKPKLRQKAWIHAGRKKPARESGLNISESLREIVLFRERSEPGIENLDVHLGAGHCGAGFGHSNFGLK
jgi:hypothetical protein